MSTAQPLPTSPPRRTTQVEPKKVIASSSAKEYCGKIELTIPALTEYVSLVRLVVSGAAQLHPHFALERIEDLRVAVSEATTNAVRAHQKISSSSPIAIKCKVASNQLEVVINDRGSGFNLNDLPDLPDPSSPERLKHESGMGLRLMRMLADESEIKPSPRGTMVRLVFRTEPS